MRFIARLIVLALLGTAAATHAASGSRPNVIFILADDLGYGDLGCHGQKHIQTPHLDGMAAEGMRFTQFYAGSAVCAPSRCALMTGLHSGHAFVRNNREVKPEGQVPLPAGTTTVGHVLKSAGYRTACVGKWGLGGPGTEGEPAKQGFDHFFGYLCQRRAHRFYPEYLWRNGERVLLPENADGKKGTYSHDLMTAEALDFVTNAKADEPFFLYLAYTIPHFDLDVPDDSMAPYEGKWDEPSLPMGNYQPQSRPRAAYAGMISRMDRDIGRLFDALKARGIDENTLVLFSSDNGPTLLKGLDVKFFNCAGGLRGLKGDLYEGGIRVPLIARWPAKIAAGTTSEPAAAFWDVLPTLADVAGANTPAGIDGISFLPILLGQGKQRKHDYLYWEFPAGAGMQAVRIGDFKGVRRNVKKDPAAAIELYNLKTDVGESNDVSAEHPELVQRIEELMRTARVESKQFPLHARTQE